MSLSLINFAYLVASVLFIVGLKRLGHPRTAVSGNLMSAVGMLLAIVFTLWDREIITFQWIIAGLLIGSGIGLLLAVRIRMTAMPQMVALLNGFGGGASTIVAGVELMYATDPSRQFLIAAGASGLIGAVTFWGSLVAFDKLQEFLLKGNPIHFPGQQALNLALLAACVVVGVLIVHLPRNDTALLDPGGVWLRCSACCSCCPWAGPTCRW